MRTSVGVVVQRQDDPQGDSPQSSKSHTLRIRQPKSKTNKKKTPDREQEKKQKQTENKVINREGWKQAVKTSRSA